MKNKLFKFWRYSLEVKLNKLPDKDRIELLANALVKELNINIDPTCQGIYVWIHGKETLEINAQGERSIKYKYTGK